MTDVRLDHHITLIGRKAGKKVTFDLPLLEKMLLGQ